MAATNPVELGFYDTPSYASEVAVAGNYAYVADGEALTIINVADPGNLSLAGFYFAAGSVQSVTVSGDFVYIAGSNHLSIVSATDPTNLVVVGFHSLPLGLGVAVDGSRVYVANRYRGLYVLQFDWP